MSADSSPTVQGGILKEVFGMRKHSFYGVGHWINNVEREIKIVDSNNIGSATEELKELLGYEPICVVEKYSAHGWYYERKYRDGKLCRKSRWKIGSKATERDVEEKFYISSSDVDKAGIKLGMYYPRSTTGWIYV